jgi:hypothetical protein
VGVVVRVLVVVGTVGTPITPPSPLVPALLFAGAGAGAAAEVGRGAFADGTAAAGALREAGALVAPPSPGEAVADARPPAPFGALRSEGWLAELPPPVPPDPPPAWPPCAPPPPPPPPALRAAVGRAALCAGRVGRAPAHRDTRQEPERDEHQPDQHLGEPARAPGLEPLLVQEVAVGVLLERLLGRDRFRRRVVVCSGHACGPPGPSIGPR